MGNFISTSICRKWTLTLFQQEKLHTTSTQTFQHKEFSGIFEKIIFPEQNNILIHKIRTDQNLHIIHDNIIMHEFLGIIVKCKFLPSGTFNFHSNQTAQCFDNCNYYVWDYPGSRITPPHSNHCN